MEEFIRLRDAVISYLKEKNRSPSTIENYYSCFNRFERHLKENGIPFSFEAVDLWLDEVTSNLSAIATDIHTPIYLWFIGLWTSTTCFLIGIGFAFQRNPTISG